jgi:hypothetical protein
MDNISIRINSGRRENNSNPNLNKKNINNNSYKNEINNNDKKTSESNLQTSRNLNFETNIKNENCNTHLEKNLNKKFSNNNYENIDVNIEPFKNIIKIEKKKKKKIS